MTALRFASALILGALAGPALAQDVQYELINNSGLTLTEFYTSPVDQESWGENILGGQSVASGESGVVTIADGETTCDYDLLFITADGQQLADRANICELASYTLVTE